LDPDTQAALAALGYLTPETAPEATLSPPNLQALSWLHQASAAQIAGDQEAQIKALGLVVHSYPEIREAWTSLIDAQPTFQATVTAHQALEHFPEDPRLLTRGAALFGEQGIHDKALELSSHAAALDPQDRLASELQVRAHLGMGQRDAALKVALSILERDPEHDVVAGLAGLLLAQTGDARAPALLEQSARGMAPPLGVRTQLAAILQANGHPEPAFELMKIEIQVYPDSIGAQRLHGELKASLASTGD
jgi:tetratricopeptide (TPR) repeat protein